MSFTQYSNFFTLFLYTSLLIPAVLLGLMGKSIKWYGIVVSVPSLCLVMGLYSEQMIQFVVFLAYELMLLMGYYYVQKKTKSKWIYYIVFILSMVPIVLVKLGIHSPQFTVLGFIGISYISFRIWQLIIEIRDHHIEKLPLSNLLYFITFFPTISSGPIDRFQRFQEDLYKSISGGEYADRYLFFGLKKLLMGVLYKFVVASAINHGIMERLPDQITLFSAVIYMYAYTLYLFFDFAGYSNFAIGTGFLLGIKVPENFNKPFLSHNMKEFWDRWHMSLSKWFGDYLFSRFILNTLRNGTFKSKKTATRCAYMVTMTVMGIWHGFYLHYILYGVYQGVMLVLTDVYLKSKTFRRLKTSRFYDGISIAVCFQVISFGMLLFSGYLFSF